MRLAVDPIVLAPEAILVERTAPCEPCARCGLYFDNVDLSKSFCRRLLGSTVTQP